MGVCHHLWVRNGVGGQLCLCHGRLVCSGCAKHSGSTDSLQPAHFFHERQADWDITPQPPVCALYTPPLQARCGSWVTSSSAATTQSLTWGTAGSALLMLHPARHPLSHERGSPGTAGSSSRSSMWCSGGYRVHAANICCCWLDVCDRLLSCCQEHVCVRELLGSGQPFARRVKKG